MSLEERSAARRARIKTHRALNHEDAERWDLLFWQELTPEERLSALVALRNDVRKVQEARGERES